MSNTHNLQTFMKQLLMTVIVFFSMLAIAVAQTTPGTPTTPEQTKQAPQQPGTMKQAPQQPSTTQQNPQQGWRWFDDNSSRDMNIDADRMKELRELDTRYRKEYDAMGNTPWTHSNYQTLTDRRNADLQRVMTPDQYQQWSRSSTKGTSPSQTPSTPAPMR